MINVNYFLHCAQENNSKFSVRQNSKLVINDKKKITPMGNLRKISKYSVFNIAILKAIFKESDKQ